MFNLLEWITTQVRGPNEVLFLCAIWWLWKWRNNLTFEHEHWELEFVLRKILVMQAEVLSVDYPDIESIRSCPWWLAVGILWEFWLWQQRIHLRHVLREANMVADYLAKFEE